MKIHLASPEAVDDRRPAGPEAMIQITPQMRIGRASIFVAVLGASNYTSAEATWSQGLEDWLGAHVRALEFIGGAPQLIAPDFVPGNKIRDH
jgi:transposase